MIGRRDDVVVAFVKISTGLENRGDEKRRKKNK
jgi:hypothetical protein